MFDLFLPLQGCGVVIGGCVNSLWGGVLTMFRRDTWWASLLGDEWRGGEGRKGAGKVLEEWLDEENFDEDGQQKRRLESFRED